MKDKKCDDWVLFPVRQEQRGVKTCRMRSARFAGKALLVRIGILGWLFLLACCDMNPSSDRQSDRRMIPPGHLTAAAGDRQILLMWNDSPLATGYSILRAPSENGPFVEIAITDLPSFIDRDVTNGSPLYYQVVARNGTGDSEISGIVSALPGIPVLLPMADPDATAETRALFTHLQQITALRQAGRGILFGLDTAYGIGMFMYDEPRDGHHSDIHTLTGKAPAVVAYDAAGLVGDWWNATDPWYQDLRQQTRSEMKTWIKAHYEAGGINTLHWHLRNYMSMGSYDSEPRQIWRIAPPETCDEMIASGLSVPGAGSHFEVFKARVDDLCDWLLELEDDQGRPIPVIFRPFHENSGEWFWWGKGLEADSQIPLPEYQASFRGIWKWMVEYITETRGVHNLIWAISPNGHGSWDPCTESMYLAVCPDLQYVDLLGIDQYVTLPYSSQPNSWEGGVIPETTMIVELARGQHKIMAFTEGGFDWGHQVMALRHNRVFRTDNGSEYIDWELVVDSNGRPIPIAPDETQYRYAPSGWQRDYVASTLEESTLYRWWTEKTIGPLDQIGGVAYFLAWSNGVPDLANNPKVARVYGPVPGTHTGDDFVSGWRSGLILLAGEGPGNMAFSYYQY